MLKLFNCFQNNWLRFDCCEQFWLGLDHLFFVGAIDLICIPKEEESKQT